MVAAALSADQMVGSIRSSSARGFEPDPVPGEVGTDRVQERVRQLLRFAADREYDEGVVVETQLRLDVVDEAGEGLRSPHPVEQQRVRQAVRPGLAELGEQLGTHRPQARQVHSGPVREDQTHGVRHGLGDLGDIGRRDPQRLPGAERGRRDHERAAGELDDPVALLDDLTGTGGQAVAHRLRPSTFRTRCRTWTSGRAACRS